MAKNNCRLKRFLQNFLFSRKEKREWLATKSQTQRKESVFSVVNQHLGIGGSMIQGIKIKKTKNFVS